MRTAETANELAVESGLIQLVFRADESLSAEAVAQRFTDLQSFVSLAALNDEGLNFAQFYRRAHEAHADVQISRISKNSPLEILMWVSAGTGSLTVSGTALIALWERYKKAKARAGVWDSTRRVSAARAEGEEDDARLHRAQTDYFVEIIRRGEKGVRPEGNGNGVDWIMLTRGAARRAREADRLLADLDTMRQMDE